MRETPRDTTRINETIREREVRLIDLAGEHIGVVSIEVALNKAREASLDLVEVSNKSKPHVCRIMDYGQYKYQQAKKVKESKKKQKQIVVKEVMLRPRIEEHDYQFKIDHAIKFLEHGDKVRFIMQFRGREMAHKEIGQKVMNRVIADLVEQAQVEQAPKMEGRFMNMTLTPLPSKKKREIEDVLEAEESVGDIDIVVPEISPSPENIPTLEEDQDAGRTEV